MEKKEAVIKDPVRAERNMRAMLPIITSNPAPERPLPHGSASGRLSTEIERVRIINLDRK